MYKLIYTNDTLLPLDLYLNTPLSVLRMKKLNRGVISNGKKETSYITGKVTGVEKGSNALVIETYRKHKLLVYVFEQMA